jgi:hypothetical protein
MNSNDDSNIAGNSNTIVDAVKAIPSQRPSRLIRCCGVVVFCLAVFLYVPMTIIPLVSCVTEPEKDFWFKLVAVPFNATLTIGLFYLGRRMVYGRRGTENKTGTEKVAGTVD